MQRGDWFAQVRKHYHLPEFLVRGAAAMYAAVCVDKSRFLCEDGILPSSVVRLGCLRLALKWCFDGVCSEDISDLGLDSSIRYENVNWIIPETYIVGQLQWHFYEFFTTDRHLALIWKKGPIAADPPERKVQSIEALLQEEYPNGQTVVDTCRRCERENSQPPPQSTSLLKKYKGFCIL